MVSPEFTVDARHTTPFENMVLADHEFYRPRAVSMILGADVYSQIIRPGLFAPVHGMPIAQNTMFGWVISGTFH